MGGSLSGSLAQIFIFAKERHQRKTLKAVRVTRVNVLHKVPWFRYDISSFGDKIKRIERMERLFYVHHWEIRCSETAI